MTVDHATRLRLRRERTEQGFPAEVQDPAVLAAAAVIVTGALRPVDESTQPAA